MWKINKKYTVLLLVLLLFLAVLFNANNFLWFINNASWNYYFNKWEYKEALNYHKKVKDNDYNLWGDYYKLKEYNNSIKSYEKTLSNTGKKEDLKVNYNLWNAYFKYWELDPDTEKKINSREKSLENYKIILDKKEDKKTRENYLYVKKKLDELKKSQDEKKESSEDSQNGQDSNNENNSWSDNKDKKEENKQDKDSKWNEENNEKNNSEDKKSNEDSQNNKDSQNKEKELSEEQERELREYNEQLKQEQKNYWNNFWKKSSEKSDDLFDIINQDPFFWDFNDSILKQDEKDW